jgi:hypothetical protein
LGLDGTHRIIRLGSDGGGLSGIQGEAGGRRAALTPEMGT